MNEKRAKLPAGLGPVIKVVEKNKYVILVLLAGLLIILWPTGGGGDSEPPPALEQIAHPLAFALAEQEERIARALSRIEGAGEVVVVLSLRTSLEQEVAVNEDGSGRRETVTVSTGQGTQSEVTLRYRYPEYQGALIVSRGADDPTVRLQITQAVAALTGLGTDRITVTKMGAE
ncbi:MAG: stage III sporulation protein AG [Oscillospiraceae bacterium]|nr:stage III sporulation protein AG [Oscillospiraceae bacterium]